MNMIKQYKSFYNKNHCDITYKKSKIKNKKKFLCSGE